MPSAQIDVSEVAVGTTAAAAAGPVIATPAGLAIVEIQGDLNLPDALPAADAPYDVKSRFATVDGLYTAIQFGTMILDPRDPTKVTLYIGKSQRLLGTIVTLATPLGVLRMDAAAQQIKMVDIVRRKVLFKDRPLPIM
ncbi:Chromosome transmission fidelity protein 8 [[Candida] zeylanoides]|jgi:chromosome transmission fidelity protein 8